jgi:hypothetical protein
MRTLSTVDGVSERWKVEMRMASAWRWFMLALNWSCSIRARSSHMLSSDSQYCFSTAWLLMHHETPTETATRKAAAAAAAAAAALPPRAVPVISSRVDLNRSGGRAPPRACSAVRHGEDG